MPTKREPSTRRGGALVFFSLLAVALLVGGLGAWWLIEAGAVRWLAEANRWLAINLIEKLGYLGVFALMFVESSLVPFPSEIVMPPAGDLAARLPQWSLGGVIAAGVLGSVTGGLFNYGLARLLGRPILIGLIGRFGGYLRLSLTNYYAAESLFKRHGAISTFTGRLIPGIRQIISLPAGLARMNLAVFVFFTALGSGLWVALLAWLGYAFASNPEGLSRAIETNSRWAVLAMAVLAGGYLIYRRLRHRGKGRGRAGGLSR